MSWQVRLTHLNAAHAVLDASSSAVRKAALCDLAMLCRDAPTGIQIAYRTASEAQILAAADSLRDDLDRGRLAWTVSGNDYEIAMTLGGQMRALDSLLIADPETLRPPPHPDAILNSRHDCFMLARANPRWSMRDGPGNGFRRRGTPHFRFLPRKIGAGGHYTVELEWKARLQVGSIADTDRNCLAAVFPGQTVNFVEGRPDWLAESAAGDDAESQLEEHLEAAFRGNFLAAVWPELNLPPARLEQLRDGLERRGLTSSETKGPRVVAAGSWHTGEDGDRRNRMQVLDRYGADIMYYDKSISYDLKGRAEAICGDPTVRVLVTPDAVIGFAICADFCELELNECPYEELDLDLVLVSSLGNAATMNGHRAKAAKLSARWGTRTLVCQQNDDQSDSAGFVFPPISSGDRVKTKKAVNLRKIRFTGH